MPETPESVPSVEQLQAAVLHALRDDTGVLDPLRRVCRACAELLPVDGASISVMVGTQHRETLYASDPVIDRLEALQFSLGEGPCYEAFDTGRPVLVADLAADAAAAWPVFAAEVAGEPVGAVFAFPLQHGAARVGAIDLYRRTPGWLSTQELATALRVADIAAAALLGLPPATSDGEVSDVWLAELPRSREAVHQATGMLIAAYEVPAAQALARLRGYAFGRSRLVDEVAADLVDRRLDPTDIDM